MNMENPLSNTERKHDLIFWEKDEAFFVTFIPQSLKNWKELVESIEKKGFVRVGTLSNLCAFIDEVQDGQHGSEPVALYDILF